MFAVLVTRTLDGSAGSVKERHELRTSPGYRASSSGALFTLLALALAWTVFAPTAIGGRTAYVTVTGSSMEPGFRPGDLIIVRRAARYEVGDVVVYRHPEIGAVIHRIVERSGERFILQGDNNSWMDSYRPSQSEVVGRQWVHIPFIGTAMTRLRSPQNLLLLAGTLAGMMMMTTPNGRSRQMSGRRHGRMNPPATPGGASATLLDARGREAAATLALVALVCLLAAAVTFTRPAERAVTSDLTYEQTGAFTYSAPAPPGIYDGAGVTTGDPVFHQFTDSVTISFDYLLSTDAATRIDGSWTFDAVVSGSNGWKRTLPLSEPGTFSGSSFTARGMLDLAEVQRITDDVAARTGLDQGVYTITIRPQVSMSGILAGQPLDDTFTPELRFQIDPLQMRLVDGAATDAAILQPYQSGVVSRSGSEPNTISILGWGLSLALARAMSVAGLVLTAVMLAWIVVQTARVQFSSESTRIQAAYGEQLVEVTDTGILPEERIISVTGFNALARIAARDGAPILHQVTGTTHRYVVTTPAGTYQYVLVPEAQTGGALAGAQA
jgi:signal peptidase I